MMERHQASRGRLDRRTARELEAAERDSLVDLAVSDGVARLAQARIQNGVSLGYQAMQGITQLERTIHVEAQGNPYLADRLRLIEEAVTYGCRDVVFNYTNGTFR
jgi:hypothetical protein